MGVAGIMYGWLGGKERRSQREHEELVVFSMNDFNERDQPNKTEQDTSSSVTSRPEHTMPGVKKNRMRHLHDTRAPF